MLGRRRMPASPPSLTPEPSRLLWWAALACSVAAVAWFLWAVSQRLPYPHELEWMEGALGDHAWRVANGLPLYSAPTAEHLPFLYAPLLFWLGAALIGCGIDEITALRLVATACSIGSAMLIGHWVRREVGRVVPGLVASGLFVAGYGWLAWWYDLARNDSLFVLLMLGVGYQLRHGGSRRWLWAAVLATAALLAKQSALMWLPCLGVGALCFDWRMALRFGIAAALASGIAVGVLHLASDGWSTFYLFEMPSHHGWVGDRKLGFWVQDLVPMLPLVAVSLVGFLARCRDGAPREALLLAAFGSGALVTSWFSRLHVGGFDNVMMYGFAGACVLGPIAAARARASWSVGAAALLLVQFGWLAARAHGRGLATLLPSAAHAQAHEQLRAFVAAQPGPVWIPGHGAISTRAGKGTGAHGQAIFDLLQLLPRTANGWFDFEALQDHRRLSHLSPRAQEAVLGFLEATAKALREQRFAAVVVDLFGSSAQDVWRGLFGAAIVGADGRLDTDDDVYTRREAPLLTEPRALCPLLGFEVHSPYALLPNR